MASARCAATAAIADQRVATLGPLALFGARVVAAVVGLRDPTVRRLRWRTLAACSGFGLRAVPGSAGASAPRLGPTPGLVQWLCLGGGGRFASRG